MNHPRTVLVVAPYYPPHVGGLERYVHEVTRRISDAGAWRVVVLTTGGSNVCTIEKEDGVTVRRVPIDFTLSRTPWSFRWIGMVRSALREIRPDLVHIHTPVPGLGDLAALCTPRHTPVLVTYHAVSMRKGRLWSDSLVWFYEHTLLQLLLRRAAHIACVSEAVRLFLAPYRHKSSVITPAVDTDMFRPEPARRSPYPSVLCVAGLGRADRHKGVDDLVRACAEVATSVPELELTVVGEGDLRSVYEGRARMLNIPHVRFVGALHGAALVAEYQRAHLFVLATHNDSFGMVLIEAMAACLPAVSTRVGSIPELVMDGVTGYTTTPGDTQKLAERIRACLVDASATQAMGIAGRRLVEGAYRWDERVNAYLARYHALCTQRPCVAHVSAYYPPHTGGMEVVACEVSRALARRGYRVEVLTSTCGAEGVPRVERDTNYRVRRLRTFEVAHTPIIWSLLPRLLLLPRGTLLHVHLAQALVPELALVAAWIRGFPILAQFHLDVEPSGRLGWLFTYYKRHVLGRVLRCMQGVLVFSEEQEDLVAMIHGVERAAMYRVANAVSDSFFQERTANAPHAPLRVLAVSRLTVQKRVDRLIDAVALLPFPVELVVVGDGEDRAALEAQAAARSLQVRFVGQKTHEELHAFHAWADVYVLSSDKEGGMPLTALEAMAAGLPVVGTDVVGVRELVRDVGVCVAPTPRGIADALTDLNAHPERFPGLSARSARCAREHTWKRAVDTIERAYEQVRTPSL